jgi:hypothetical protein
MGSGWQEAGEEGKWNVDAGEDVGCGVRAYDKYPNSKPDDVISLESDVKTASKINLSRIPCCLKGA